MVAGVVFKDPKLTFFTENTLITLEAKLLYIPSQEDEFSFMCRLNFNNMVKYIVCKITVMWLLFNSN